MGIVSQLTKLASSSKLNKAIGKSAQVFSGYTSLERLLGRFFKGDPYAKQRELASKVDTVARNPWDKSYKHYTKILTKDGGTILIDSTTSLTVEMPSRVTQYPIEDGTTISDHVINENLKISLSVMWSDHNSPSTGVNASTKGLIKDVQPNKGLVPDKKDDSVTIYKKLITLRDSREPVSIITLFATYTDVILTGITLPRKGGIGITTLVADLQFEQVRKVTAKRTVVYISPNGSTGLKTSAEKNAGVKSTIPPLIAKKDTTAMNRDKLEYDINSDPALSNKYAPQVERVGYEASGGNSMGTVEQMNDFLKANKKDYKADDYYVKTTL